MTQSGNYSRSLLSAFLVAAIVFQPIGVFAQVKDGKKATEMVETSAFASKSLQRLYPIAPLVLATLYAKNTQDSWHKKFAEWIVLASAFHSGTAIKDTLQDLQWAEAESLAELLAGAVTFVLANAAGTDGVAGRYLVSASTNQVGMAYKKKLNETSDIIDGYAQGMEISEQNRAHTLDTLKSSGALTTLITAWLVKGSNKIGLTLAEQAQLTAAKTAAEKAQIAATFSSGVSSIDGLTMAGSFTAAYTLREALIEHFKHVQLPNYLSPENAVALVMSAAGGVGIMLTNPAYLGAIIPDAIFEAGVYTGTSFINPWIAFVLGALIYVKDAQAISPLTRMQATLSGALMMPLAFNAVDAVKGMFSHLYWKK